MKRKILITGVIAILLICAQVAAFAGEKTLFIKGSGIKRAGANLTTGASNILFYKGGAIISLYVPGTTTSITDFNIANGSVDDKGSGSGRNVQLTCNVGDNISAVVWTPNTGAGNYYAGTSLGMSQANYDNSTLTWSWDGMAVDYKAVAPYKPTIATFAETISTDTKNTIDTADDTASSSLVVSSRAGTGTDGLREVTGYSWLMWPEAGTQPSQATAGGASLSIDSKDLTPDMVYSFRVNHSNQWDTNGTWSDIYSYKVGGGVTPGQLVSVTVVLTKKDADHGVNTFALPFATAYTEASATPITTAQGLIDAINTAAGSKAARTFGYWDSTEQKAKGWTFKTDGSIDTYINLGNDVKPENVTIVKNQPYQVYIESSVNVRFNSTPPAAQ